MDPRWEDSITETMLTEILHRNDLSVKPDVSLKTFLDALLIQIKSYNSKTSHAASSNLMKVLQKPEGLFLVFSACFVLNTHGGMGEHAYAKQHAGMKSAFTVTILQLANQFISRKPNASKPASAYSPVDFQDLTGPETLKLSYMGGWSLKRSRDSDKSLTGLISTISRTKTDRTKQQHFTEPSPLFIKFFHQLDQTIQSNLNMTSFNRHGQNLVIDIETRLSTNSDLHSSFHSLFSSDTSYTTITKLLQLVCHFTIKSSVHNFLLDHRLNPNKQSQALRASLLNGKKKKSKSASAPASSSNDLSTAPTLSIQEPAGESAASIPLCVPQCKSKANKFVQCDKCDKWFHQRCVGVTAKTLPTGAWYCPFCIV